MNIFSRFKKSEYAKNSTILMAGTVISMVLQIVSVAWLGKYYSDEVWGIYEYFCTAYSIFLIIATGRYELAIMIPKDDNDGFILTVISSMLAVAFSIAMAVVLVLTSLIFSFSLDWVIFLPPTLAIIGVYYSVNYWLNRKKYYIKLAINRVTQGVLFVIFNLLYAFILPDKRYGLILGYMTAQLIVTIILVIYIVIDYKKLNIQLSKERAKELMIDYINFPKISVLSGVVNNIAVRLPVFLLGGLAGASVVGQYSMMNRILGAPITVISEAIRDVFRQKASKDFAKNGECANTYNTTFKTLALTAIVPFILIMIGVKPILNSLFGDLWTMAGNFVIIMTPFYYIKFIASPLTFMTYISNKQSFDMKWQISMCISSAVAFFVGYLLTNNPYIMLLMYGIALAVMYIISFSYTKKLAKGNNTNPN